MRISGGFLLLAGLVTYGAAANARPPEAPHTQCLIPAGPERDQAMQLAASLRSQWTGRQASGQAPMSVVEPSIVSGRMLTSSVNVGRAPGVPQMQVTLNAGTVGTLYFSTVLQSPSGIHSAVATTFLPAYPAQAGNQAVSFLATPSQGSSGFGLYAEPGVWTLSSITMISGDGQFLSYDAGQLAALFPAPSVTIVNAAADITPPTVGAGSILTPVVSVGGPSPFFAVNLSVADAQSGVSQVVVGFSGPPGSNVYLGANSALTLPLKKGQVVAYARMAPDTVRGNYTITSLSVCDAAGNCTTPPSAAATFPQTAFQVTD